MGPVPLLLSPWPALQAVRTRKGSMNAVSAGDIYALARLRARSHCDGNGIIFTILMLSNVDVTNGFVHRTTAFLRPKMNILVHRQFQFTKWVSRLLYWFNLFFVTYRTGKIRWRCRFLLCWCSAHKTYRVILLIQTIHHRKQHNHRFHSYRNQQYKL